jgi:hypothetical protein
MRQVPASNGNGTKNSVEPAVRAAARLCGLSACRLQCRRDARGVVFCTMPPRSSLTALEEGPCQEASHTELSATARPVSIERGPLPSLLRHPRDCSSKRRTRPFVRACSCSSVRRSRSLSFEHKNDRQKQERIATTAVLLIEPERGFGCPLEATPASDSRGRTALKLHALCR